MKLRCDVKLNTKTPGLYLVKLPNNTFHDNIKIVDYNFQIITKNTDLSEDKWESIGEYTLSDNVTDSLIRLYGGSIGVPWIFLSSSYYKNTYGCGDSIGRKISTNVFSLQADSFSFTFDVSSCGKYLLRIPSHDSYIQDLFRDHRATGAYDRASYGYGSYRNYLHIRMLLPLFLVNDISDNIILILINIKRLDYENYQEINHSDISNTETKENVVI